MASFDKRWIRGWGNAVCLTLTLLSESGASARPNILLIMCDDMGFSDIGCYGGEVDTPNLDRLARAGVCFSQFYNNGKCTTSRASLVTGLYPRFDKPHLRRNMVTLGEVLQEAGYFTALCGKWHLGRDPDTHPYHRGFSYVYGLLDGGCNFFDPARPDPAYKGGRVRYFTQNDRRITKFPEGFYTTDAFTDHAIRAIQEANNQLKPFFVHVTYTCPHYPLHAKPAGIAKYRGRYRDGWDALRQERFQRQVEIGLATEAWQLSQGDSRAYEWETSDKDFEDHRMAVYAAMIDSMDQNIGRLMQEVERSGKADNTLVMFLSDNGGCAEEPGGRDPSQRRPGPVDDYVAVGPAWGWAQNTPFRRYKSWTHEGGIATPFIVWWPSRIPPQRWLRSASHIIDIMPTLVEVADARYPQNFKGSEILPSEGTSLMPLIQGRTEGEGRDLKWFWAGNRAIRQGAWKLVWDKLAEPRWQLFNLANDRCEVHDLADAQPGRVRAMRDSWHLWAEKVGLDPRHRASH